MGNIISNTVLKALESPIPFIRDRANETILGQLGNLVEPRPRPISMAAEGKYTTWRGLTDKTFSGRQLPPDEDYNKTLPPINDVLGLFNKKQDFLDDTRTLLLPYFAQWFTDSFLRTKWEEPGQQTFAYNESNHEIDLNQIYGTAEEQTTMLRSMTGGRLKSQMIEGEEWPVHLFDQNSLEVKPEFKGLYTEDNFNRAFHNATDEHKRNSFAVGLEHGNSTIQNMLMNVLFLREHNRIAAIIADAHADWDDERVFQTTRNCMIVILIKIVIADYIKHISGAPIFVPKAGWAEDQKWYKENWISVEFALLYRWHDLIPSTFALDGKTLNSSKMRNNTALLLDVGIEQAIKDASNQKAGRLVLSNTPDFLLHVRQLSLTMARTIKLPPYVKYLEEYGLDIPKTFLQLTGGNRETAAKLEAVYGSVDKVEWFVGLFAGYSEKNGFSSKLMTAMVAQDAVTQALTNPLLARRVYNANTFSKEGFAIVEETETIAQLAVRNTAIKNMSEVGFGFDRA